MRQLTRHLKGVATAGLASTAAVALVAAGSAAYAGEVPSVSERSKPTSRIIGGSQVSADAYPFMAALATKGKGSVRDRQFCGGSLIDPSVVMTAAHCVEGADPSTLQVVVGRTVLSDAKQGQIRNVKASGEDRILVHPRYLKNKSAYDVAFITLEKPVKGIMPIKLPTAGTDALLRPGDKATVAGWGNTDVDMSNAADRLREVNVPILSHNECKVTYPGYDSTVNICAGVEGRDSCQGDSGGPLFRKVAGRQDPIQIGVVSYGDGCAWQGAPGVYTSMSSAKLWKTLSESPEGVRMKARLRR